MKKIQNVLLTACALWLAGSMLLTVGCAKNSKKTDSDTDVSESESSQPVTESNPADMQYKMTYDEEKIPAELAETMAMYFYAIDTQNYALYLEQINPIYEEAMNAFLQENYGYGLESSFEQSHQMLVQYAGTDEFTVTEIELAPASEALDEEFEDGTDFVQEFLDVYSEVLGEEFTKSIQENTEAIYDVAVTLKGKDTAGEEITILDRLETMVVETEEGFGIVG